MLCKLRTRGSFFCTQSWLTCPRGKFLRFCPAPLPFTLLCVTVVF
uniref:Uncharacterized protein n=1 Tax=Anguilla anguilla TaxID=7936 RepID=A0A0E9UPN1_ANGAN